MTRAALAHRQQYLVGTSPGIMLRDDDRVKDLCDACLSLVWAPGGQEERGHVLSLEEVRQGGDQQGFFRTHRRAVTELIHRAEDYARHHGRRALGVLEELPHPVQKALGRIVAWG